MSLPSCVLLLSSFSRCSWSSQSNLLDRRRKGDAMQRKNQQGEDESAERKKREGDAQLREELTRQMLSDRMSNHIVLNTTCVGDVAYSGNLPY